jgi:hypothetical protein
MLTTGHSAELAGHVPPDEILLETWERRSVRERAGFVR